ncbi:MAG: MFS transporter [Myxococcales bacterium]|nr:MFS transporter [Myxococcales bacterium]
MSKKLSTRTKFAYGIGQVGEQVKTRGFDLFVFFYFQQVLGLSGTLTGAAVAIALVFDAITDPLAGSLSDNWRSPRGRRHPFMYASAIPLALFWFLLFFPPSGLGQTGLFAWLTVFAILVRGAMTLYHVPHLAMGAELSDDYEERTTVVAWRTLFGLVGGVATSVIGLRVFFPESTEFPNGMLNPAGYPKVAIFGSVVMFITIWYSAWGTRDQIPHLPQMQEHHERFSWRGMLADYTQAWTNVSFRALFIGFSFFAIGMGVFQTLQTHMNVFFWELSTKQLSVLPIPFAIGFVTGIVASQRFHRRFDKKGAMMGALVVVVALGPLPVVLRLLGLFPENHSPLLLPALIVHGLFVALLFGVVVTSVGSMMADVAQELELESDKPQQGVLFSATSFAGKLASGGGHVVAGIGLDLIRFPVQAKDPSLVAPELIRNLGVLTLCAIGCNLLGIWSMSRYGISRESYTASLAALSERRREAVAEPGE